MAAASLLLYSGPSKARADTTELITSSSPTPQQKPSPILSTISWSMHGAIFEDVLSCALDHWILDVDKSTNLAEQEPVSTSGAS